MGAAQAISPWPCPEKNRLLNEVQKATEAYSATLRELVERIGVVGRAEYDRLNKAAEEARRLSSEARDRLERHIAQHGC